MAFGVLDANAGRGQAPCADPRYRATHVADCNKVAPGGGWPKCGDLCAYPEYRVAMPHQCGGPLLDAMAARYLCAFTPYRESPACAPCGDLGAVATKPVVLGPAVCANPLPAGRYAIRVVDSPKGAVAAFKIWVADQKGVTIVATKDIPAPSGSDTGMAVIFTVSSPARWSTTIWGCPTVASAKLTVDDLEHDAPADDFWSSIFGKAGSGLKLPTWAYLGVGAIVLVALAPTLFEVSKIAAIREEHKT